MPQAKADYRNVPTVVFSHPTIGVVGLTEAQAQLKFGEDKIKVYTSTFTNLWYGPWKIEPNDKPKTAMKLVCLLPDEKVIGIHTIGTCLLHKKKGVALITMIIYLFLINHIFFVICDLS